MCHLEELTTPQRQRYMQEMLVKDIMDNWRIWGLGNRRIVFKRDRQS